MIRADIINTIGRDYLTSNIENDEFSYPKAYSNASLPFTPIRNRTVTMIVVMMHVLLPWLISARPSAPGMR